MPRRPPRRPLRLAVSGLLLVAVAGCGEPADEPSDEPVAGHTSTAEPGTAEPTPSPVESVFPSAGSSPAPVPEVDEPQQGESAVGRLDLVTVDPSRGTAEGVGSAAEGDRRIPVRVLYPARGRTGDRARSDRPVAEGKFPLVVFSHGLGADGPTYEEVMAPVAAAGYVVAMPTFPLSSGRNPSYLDVVNQPEDVSFVIDELLDAPEIAASIDRRRIAVGGHSLGAATSFGVTWFDGLADARVDAVLGYAGVRLDLGDGGYRSRPGVPTLLVHGDRDGTLPASGSAEVFRGAQGPAYFLRLRESGHADLFLGDEGEVVLEATLAFLDAQLRDDPAALARMGQTVQESGVGTWRTRNTG